MTHAPSDPEIAATEQADRSSRIVPLVILLLAFALVLRVLIAAVIVPGSGFRVDVHDFAIWARDLAANGPGGFYREGYFVDYPPGYLYVLWAIGTLGGALGGIFGQQDLVPELVKVPGVLADIGVGWLLFLIGRRYFGPWAGLAAAAVYLLNPGVIFDSAVWGQIDSVGTLVLLGALYTLARGWTEAASALAVVATLVKFQYGLIIPIVLVVGLKRHLAGRSSESAFSGRPDLLRVATSLAAALATLLVMMFPFRLALIAPADQVHSLWHRFLEAAGTYTGLTINAFNLWMNPWTDLATTGQWGDDRLPAFTVGSFAVTGQLIGSVLFFAVLAVALHFLWRRDDGPAVLFVALVLAVAFFVVPTRVHERYLFPALAFAAPFVAVGWGWRALYGVLSVSFFFNIYYAYTISYFENPGVTRDPLIGATILSPPGVYLLSISVVLALGTLVVAAAGRFGVPWEGALRGRPAHVDGVPTHVALGGAASSAPAATSAAAEATMASPPPAVAVEAGSAEDDESPRATGFRGWLSTWRRWARRDPADPFYEERPRRFGLPDGVLLGLIVVIALLFRLFRLDAPVGMHFDEVYHARSATEWLANWQYGANRDAYEWTHPMMAKYLIAAGILVADPNKVIGLEELAEPATLLAVAPARSLVGREESILFTVEGGELVARDADTHDERARWGAPGEPATLTYDDALERLLVGYAGGGELTVYDLADLLRDSDGTADPPAARSIDTGLTAIEEIEVIPGGTQVAVRGPASLSVIDVDSGEVAVTQPVAASGVAYLPQIDSTSAAILVVQRDGPESDASEGTDFGTVSDGGPVLRFLDPATLQDAIVQKDAAEGTEAALCPSGYREVEGASDDCAREPIPLPAPPVGPMLVHGDGADTRVFVPTLDEDGQSRLNVVRPAEHEVEATVRLPGPVSDLVHHEPANIVYLAGPDRVWVMELHGDERSGFAVFDATELPGEPVALAVDASGNSPTDDNERLIVATTGGETAGPTLVAVDAGSNAFAWRLAGAIFGAILAGLIFLLGATMFQRRRIAVLAGVFVAFDAFSFAQSRISMNDVFVGVFILAAYLLFWQIWSGRWARSAWWALPLVGVLIGLAAANKWVGFYALAGLLVLVLARSDLGRLVLLAGFTFVVIVAGIGAPWPFLALLILAVVVMGALAWARPMRIAADDLRALPATGIVVGLIGFAFALAAGELTRADPVGLLVQLLARGADAVWPAAVMLAVSAVLIGARAYHSLRNPASDAGWFLPSQMGGFSWPWIGASLVVIPLLVYTLSYVPYLAMGHGWIESGGPSDGYRWSLEELQTQMFGYHFGLKAGHPASSPWWAWPLSLRPVWFYQGNFDGATAAVIYNGGNFVLFALGIPAMIYAAVHAWRRQSLALLLIVVAFAFQWLPWTRIERATFLYHYFAAMPFMFLAVAYLADDALRHRVWRSIAMGLGMAAVVVGALLYPIASGLVMPNWYTQFFQVLPPWNFGAQFPDPPQSDRVLVSTGVWHLVAGLAIAVLAALAGLYGRDFIARFRSRGAPSDPPHPVPESG